jgi:flagellar assembly factor FliW
LANATAGETTTVESTRFGTVTFAESDVFVFPWGLPGFDELRHFLVLSLDNQDGFFWLQSLDDPQVSLPLADPWACFPDYEPKLPTFARLSLDLERPEEFVTLCVAVIPEEGPVFMNLMAPIVLNLRTRIGRQVALEGSNYSVAHPVPTNPDGPAGQAEAVAE